MNFFKRIGQAIAGFFKSDLAKRIINYAKDILAEFLGNVAISLIDKVKEEVSKAEKEGGSDKYERVFKAVRKSFPDIAEREINYAIESAVMALIK
jgi:hypothetical protein